MRSNWITALLAVTIFVSTVAWVGAAEPAPKEQPAEKISVSAIVQPNELRSYKISVGIEGCIGVADNDPLLVNALNTMRVLHQYGRREGDGLLQLDIRAIDVQATINGEKSPASLDQFPRLTLLLDTSWNTNKIFGTEGTHYAGQVPGLNYANLILLFNIPDIDKGHAIGEIWTSKVKSPGKSDEVKIANTIKSKDEADGVKTVTVHQDYVWGELKLDGGRSVKTTAAVDSTLDLITGKLLKSHAECQLLFVDPAQSKPENRQYKAITKIDILLEK